MSILDIQELCVRVGAAEKEVFAINGVNLRIAQGEVHALVGETGAGKSMLAKSIMRLLPESAHVRGKIFVGGIDCLELNAKEVTAYRGSVASVALQNPRSSLSATRTIGDQLIDRISSQSKVSKASARMEAKNLLESVGISDTHRTLKAFPHQMSGGMCQRIMIALAISSKPRLLIADEPTNSLDATLTENILQLISDYAKRENAAVLIISHDIASVATISDRISVLYAGSIVEQNATADLLGDPRHPYTRMLLDSVPKMDGLAVFSDVGSMPILAKYPTDCAFISRCSRAISTCHESKPALIAMSDLHSLACFNSLDKENAVRQLPTFPLTYSSREIEVKNPLLSLKSLTFIYKGRFGTKGFKALDNLDLELYEGENLGIVGESGSGKSTLGRILSGLEKASSGEIKGVVLKQKLFHDIFQEPIRDEIQMVFQDPILTLDPKLEVNRSIVEPLLRLKLPKVSVEERLSKVITDVRVDRSLLSRRPRSLSGGQAQRVGIGRAIISNPKIIVFDEPTSQLDVTTQAQILNVIRENSKSKDFTSVYISHDLATVKSICDRVIVMYRGKIVETGPVDQVFNNPVHPYTRAMLASVRTLDSGENREFEALLPEDEFLTPHSGCNLFGRCPVSVAACERTGQNLLKFEENHFVACSKSNPETSVSKPNISERESK